MNVWIWNPNVGGIWLVSSPLNFLIIVVFPELSKPRIRILISLSYCQIFWILLIRPIIFYKWSVYKNFSLINPRKEIWKNSLRESSQLRIWWTNLRISKNWNLRKKSKRIKVKILDHCEKEKSTSSKEEKNSLRN